LTTLRSFATKQACAQEFLLGEELNNIVVGLEQRLGAKSTVFKSWRKNASGWKRKLPPLKSI
jgi:hypothetical protein